MNVAKFNHKRVRHFAVPKTKLCWLKHVPAGKQLILSTKENVVKIHNRYDCLTFKEAQTDFSPALM